MRIAAAGLLILGVAGAALADASAPPDFDALDRNGNGRLTEQELARAGVFKRWDSDGDGYLSQAEITRHRNVIDTTLAPDGGPRELIPLDRNGDTRIAEREYYHGVFLAYDRDGDGTLAMAEWPEFGIW